MCRHQFGRGRYVKTSVNICTAQLLETSSSPLPVSAQLKAPHPQHNHAVSRGNPTTHISLLLRWFSSFNHTCTITSAYLQVLRMTESGRRSVVASAAPDDLRAFRALLVYLCETSDSTTLAKERWCVLFSEFFLDCMETKTLKYDTDRCGHTSIATLSFTTPVAHCSDSAWYWLRVSTVLLQLFPSFGSWSSAASAKTVLMAMTHGSPSDSLFAVMWSWWHAECRWRAGRKGREESPFCASLEATIRKTLWAESHYMCRTLSVGVYQLDIS